MTDMTESVLTDADFARMNNELLRMLSLIYAFPPTQYGAQWLRRNQKEDLPVNPAVSYRIEMPKGVPTSIRLDAKGCVVLSDDDIGRIAVAVVDEMDRRSSEALKDWSRPSSSDGDERPL